VDEIARDVREFSEKYDFVFTSGGIGPTHDDVTIEGVSAAFGIRPVISDILRRMLEEKCKDLTPARLKMAEIPEGAELLDCRGLMFPLIKFRNIFIFPGIPEQLRERFAAVKDRFNGPRIFLRKVYLKESESVLAPHLNEIVGLRKGVKVGSYPVINNQDYSVMVTLESTSEAELDSTVTLLLGKISGDKIVRVV
jgi:FAD synthetase